MYQIIDQMLNGEKRKENEHDELVYTISSELVETHDIVFDAGYPVPVELKMADRVYTAALELLERVGIYSIDTGRVVKLSEEEINRSMQNNRASYTIGEGIDTTELVFRDVLDDRKPVIIGGPCGTPISIEAYIPVHRSYAKLNCVDSIAPATIYETFDTQLMNTPLSLYTANTSVTFVKEACALEGRPGICFTSPPSISNINAAIAITHPRFMRQGDIQEIYQQLDLKTNFEAVTKAIHYRNIGCLYLCDQGFILGGKTTDRPEQIAIQVVAESIKARLIHRGHLYSKQVDDLRTGAGSTLEAMWASFIGSMALSRNSSYLHCTDINDSAGPCSTMMMYETAAQTIGNVVCGTDLLAGPMPNGAHVIDHAGGLDAKLMADVAELATNLSIEDANFLCLGLFRLYEGKLKRPDYGKPFKECYDPRTLEPSEEYLEKYNQVMRDIYKLMGMGSG
ncbi:MAG: monomethylamine:corrinoid methyltransferase [Methanosarcinaceae archaeon]|nr:monomethylamine:corrinoid methyltransferase [Methanosarcinaceae archaeon]